MKKFGRFKEIVNDWKERWGHTGETDEHIVGVIIATYFEWNGNKVIDCFLEALTDSNYHKERKMIETVLKKEKRRKTKKFKANFD